MALYVGIDIGSLAAKRVLVDDAGGLVAHAIVPTGARVTVAAESALALSAALGLPINFHGHSQIMGALGAALIGRSRCLGQTMGGTPA